VLCGVVGGDPARIGGLLEGTVGALAGASVILAAGVTARRGGADAVALGGVGSLAPRLATVSALAALALAGVPLSACFAARVRVWEGAWQALPNWAAFASLTPLALLGLGLWWSYQRVFLGERRGAGRFRDLDLREAAALFTLLLAVFLVGLDPVRWLELLAR
jgi:NADH:ubiquinone oxidoreductase subunit 4 (subunit M)